MQDTQNALITYGAVTAARAALDSVPMYRNTYAAQCERLVEELRKLCSLIAKEEGL
jgi:hypothetical protein